MNGREPEGGSGGGGFCIGNICIGIGPIFPPFDPFGFPDRGRQDPGPQPPGPRTLPGALPSAQPLPRPVPSTFPPGARPPPFGDFEFPDAANDPVFKARKKILQGLGRVPILGRVIDVAEVLVAAIEGIQDRTFGDILRRQEVDLENIIRRAAETRRRRALADLEATKLERAPPGIQDFPDVQPPAPSPQTTPVGDPLPGVSVPTTIPIPVPLPTTIPSTSPVAVPVPSPRRTPIPSSRPGSIPASTPGRILVPSFFPLPSSAPSVNPLTVGDPSLLTGGSPSTGSQLGQVVQSFTNFPQPVPQPDASERRRCRRKCDDDDDPRTQCFKGLYREGVSDTDFTEWQEIDCFTGQEIASNQVPTIRGV